MNEEVKIAVVDDSAEDADLMRQCAEEAFNCAEISLFSSASEMMQAKEKFSLTLLDIDLGKEDGIEKSRNLAHMTEYIVYVTSAKERMRDAFSTKTVGYILKSDSKDQMTAQLKSIGDKYLKNVLRVTALSQEIDIPMHDVYRIAMENRKMYLYLNKREVVVRGLTLRALEEAYPENLCRVSYSELVNLDHVVSVKGSELSMDNDTVVACSRRLAKDVQRAFFKRVMG